MGITVVLLFPLGAVFQRLIGTALVHGAIQILALALLLAGFGLGVELAKMRDLVGVTLYRSFLLSLSPFPFLLPLKPASSTSLETH